MSDAKDQVRNDKSEKPEKPETVDYLEVDSPIAGQNYVCMSFLSPESIMEDKNAFIVSKFLQSICKSQDMEFDKVMSQYKDFTYKYKGICIYHANSLILLYCPHHPNSCRSLYIA